MQQYLTAMLQKVSILDVSGSPGYASGGKILRSNQLQTVKLEKNVVSEIIRVLVLEALIDT